MYSTMKDNKYIKKDVRKKTVYAAALCLKIKKITLYTVVCIASLHEYQICANTSAAAIVPLEQQAGEKKKSAFNT